MRSFVALTLVVGCADPVVGVELVLPDSTAMFDTSCITAVEVRVTGENYLQDSEDYERSCIELQGGSSYTAIRDAIRGRFDVAVPDSGISGIEIYGWSGPTACNEYTEAYVTPDLLFFGRGGYIGQDTVEIPITPNVSCARKQLNVRMFDMIALTGGATCQVAGMPVGDAGVGVGTLVPRLYGKGSEFFGNLTGATSTNNLASFMAPTQTGPKSCLALDGGSEQWGGSTGCVIGGATVCAAPGDTELAAVPNSVLGNIANFDAVTMAKFPGVVIGSVWSSATPRTTVSGATVAIDQAHGKVIYVDPPNAQGLLGIRADQSATGPSGLFVMYTDTLVSAKISAGGASRTVTLGADDDTTAAAMVIVGP